MAQQSITLQTSDADIIAGDIIGRVSFAASNESSGAEAKWIAASIYAQATGEFTSTVNPTNLVFATSDSDGVTPRYKITNVGHFLPELNTTYELGSNSFKFNNIFAATGTLDRVATTGIQLTGSASQSGLLYINNSNLISSSPNVLFSNADLASPKLIFKASGSLTPDVSLNILTTATNVASGVQTLSVQGSAGELFSITDVLDSGTIFSVNDISGLGLIEADADGTVTLVRYGTNVAVGNVVPTQKLHVAGNLRVSGAIYDSLNSPGTSGQVLVSTSGGTDWRSLGEITGVDGVGTSGYVARWIDGDTIGTGVIYDNGTNVGIGTTSPSYTIDILKSTPTIRLLNDVANGARLHLGADGGGGTVGTFTTLHDLRFFTSGVVRSRITKEGLFGIATDSPTAQLQVNTASATATGVIIRGAAAQTADLLQIQNSAGTTLLDIDAGGSLSGVGSGIFMQRVGVGLSNPAYPLDILTSGQSATAVRIKTANNINVATLINANSDAFPVGNLWLSYGSTAPALISAQSNSLFLRGGSASNGYITFNPTTINSTTAEIMRVNQTGVGIFTTSPTQALDVRGTGYFSESVRTSGTIVFASGNTGGVGVMQWNNGEGTVQLGLKGGNVNVELAQDNVVLCYNGVGSSLSKGQVVYVSGAQGQRPSINLALGTSDLRSARTIGVVDEPIDVGGEGFIATFGVVTNLNTEDFTEGSGLWLSATTPGALTMTRPVAPNHGVFVGWCLNSHASAGRIFVNVQNGLELEELHDVLIQNVASGQLIQYDTSNNTWRNRTPLQAGLVEGVGTSGYVARWTGTNTIATGVIYDNGTNVGIGNPSPVAKLDVDGNIYFGASGNNTQLLQANGINSTYISSKASLFLNIDSNNDGSNDIFAIGRNRVTEGTGSTDFAILEGLVGINTTSPTAQLQINSVSATRTGVIVRGAASQTADLLQIQNSAGTTLLDIDAGGSLSGISGIFNKSVGIGNNVKYLNSSPTNSIFEVSDGNSPTWSATNKPYTLISSAGSSNGYYTFAVQTLFGTGLYVSNAANVGIGNIASPSSKLHVATSIAGTGGIIVQGAASQSADLQQWQNNTGDVLLRVDAAGSISGVASGIFMDRIGIGLSNPSYPLHVNGTAYVAGNTYVTGWYYGRRFGTYGWVNGDTYVQTQDGYSTLFNVGTTEIARITSSGLGIGTTSPSQKLDINGSLITNASIYVSGNNQIAQIYNDGNLKINAVGGYTRILTNFMVDGNVYLNDGDVYGLNASTKSLRFYAYDSSTHGDIQFYSNNSVERMRVDSAGNIGIGTTSPTQKLDVRGNTYVSGVLIVSSGNFGESIVFHNGYKIRSFGGGGLEILGNPYIRIGNTGGTYVAGFTAGSNAGPGLSIGPIASQTGLIITGAAAQSADLQQWQNSSSATLLRVDAAGSLSGVASGIFMSYLKVGSVAGDNITRAYIEENFTSQQSNGLRVRGVGSSTGRWKGRIVAGGDNVAFLMGEYNSQAWLGGHNVALNAWSPLRINPDGTTDLYLGNTGTAGANPILTIRNSNGNVGVGTSTPSEMLHINGNIRVSGAYYDSNNSAGTNGQVLTSTATGTDWKSLSEITGVDGVGTSGYAARWIDTDTIGTGIIYDNGTSVGVGTTSPAAFVMLDVAGAINTTKDTANFLVIKATNIGSSPASTARIDMYGYSGRGIGTKYFDANYSGEEWFNGTNYLGNFDRWSVGYDAAGTQSEYTSKAYFTILSNGNVGIGTSTSSPSTRLHIRSGTGDVSESGGLTIEGTGTGARAWQLTPTTSDTLLLAIPGLRVAAFNSAGKFFAGGLGGTSGAGARFTASTSGVTVGQNYTTAVPTPEGLLVEGNVGIGDISPSDKLVVNGRTRIDGTNKLCFGQSTGGWADIGVLVANSGTIVIRNYDGAAIQERMRIIGNNGNVGINSSSPSAKLQIETGSTTATGIVVRGAAAQTADLQQWQNSAGTKTAYVDAGGNIYSSGIFRSTNVGNNSGFRMNYAALTETASALSTIVGNNIIAGSTNSTVRRHANSADSGNFMQLMYDRGITFHTGLTSALNTDVAITTNERMRIALNGNVGIGGTTSPAELLTIYGDNKNIQLQSATNAGSNAIIFADTAARFEIYKPTNSSDLRFKSRDGGVGDVMTIGYTNGYVGIGTTNPQYLLDVSGTIRANHVTAITKSFLIEHPTKPGKQLRYASLEGPENGIYVRGITTDNEIELPEYWAELVDLRSITVDLTALKYPQPNLYVEKITSRSIKIGSDRPVMASYTVYGERKDVPKLEVEC